MKTKDLKINFRYLGGNIACLSVDSIDGESVHNDINNEEAIIIFNSIVGEKENCQTVKTLLKENQELKEKLDKYENPEDMTLMMMWCTEKVKDENEKLKKQLEEINNFIKKCGFVNIEQVALNYCGLLSQQKEFIEWLEAMSIMYENEYKDINTTEHYKCVLQKYKEITGVSNENKKETN